jgi:hypothetical protein
MIARCCAASATSSCWSPTAGPRLSRGTSTTTPPGWASELRTLEKTLAAQGERRSALEARLADPDFYSSTEPAAQRALLAEHGKLLKEIDVMETRWLELSERLEAG